MPGNLTQDLSPICFIPRSDLGLHAVEWNNSGYHDSNSLLKFGIIAYQACVRHSFVGNIAAETGIPVWTPSCGATLVCGSGKTAHGLRDFAYFSSPGNFST